VNVKVRDAESEADLDLVRRLFRGFVAWHRTRQGQDQARVTAYFDDQAWEAELAGLPGAYAATGGWRAHARLAARRRARLRGTAPAR
jgi:hypothetical protein